MGPLAGLLVELGHVVSGSDVAFDPPIGPALEQWGVKLLRGFDPAHLDSSPDLVVVGNVCRPDNPEARAARERGFSVTHIAGALSRFALFDTSPLVVAGTHGKTTSTALAAFLLDRANYDPGFLIGGVPINLPRSFRAAGRRRLPSLDRSRRRTPFVIEGDEYDTAYFEKTPKFLHYRPEVLILTSIEHDHIDIYPSLDSYLRAFEQLVALVPETGLIVANAADPLVRQVISTAQAKVTTFALEDEDTDGLSAQWVAGPANITAERSSFDLFAGGMALGRFASRLHGRHNLKNSLGVIAAVVEGYGVRPAELGPALLQFEGVRRRQELLGTPGGILLYDDFAHHPSAVAATLSSLRARHPEARIVAVFEPKSATACRRIHQLQYPRAFSEADQVILAPLGRRNLPPEEALDLDRLTREIIGLGRRAERASNRDAIAPLVAQLAEPGDLVVLLSNGAFGDVARQVAQELGQKAIAGQHPRNGL